MVKYNEYHVVKRWLLPFDLMHYLWKTHRQRPWKNRFFHTRFQYFSADFQVTSVQSHLENCQAKLVQCTYFLKTNEWKYNCSFRNVLNPLWSFKLLGFLCFLTCSFDLFDPLFPLQLIRNIWMVPYPILLSRFL